jgi:hypothetical protein
MSKNRFDRRRMPQRWDNSYTRLGGGLDQSSSMMGRKPGRLMHGLNVEERYGEQGYSFIAGYEGFDGRSSPSRAQYWTLGFNTGTGAINVGDTVTSDALDIALVIGVTVTSGSFGGGNAAGQLVLTDLIELAAGAPPPWGGFERILVGGVLKARATNFATLGVIGDTNYDANLSAAREALRALITAAPGGGGNIYGITGGVVFNNAVYVMRNSATGDSATLWKATSSGWTAIRTGMHPDGEWKFEVANFSGTPDALRLYGVNGRSRMFRLTPDDALGYTSPIWGSESLSTSSNTIGFGAKTFTADSTLRDWVAGDELKVWDVDNAANWMAGTVTSYNSGTNTLILNITSTNGSGTKTNWEIGRWDYSDKPFALAEHKDHMFLAYPSGQLQTSNLGNANAYTTTAALFGLGREIVDLVSLKGEALGVFCEDKIDVIEGSSAIDWSKGTYSKKLGGIEGSVQEMDGNAIYLSRNGLTTLQATQNFGNFETAVFSGSTERLLNELRGTLICSRVARNNLQYRLYFEDGWNLRYTLLNGNPTPAPDEVSAALCKYDVELTCAFSGIIDGEDRMFFGTTDGEVMEEDAGTSFAGESISYVALLAYEHFRSIGTDKQFHKMEAEVVSPDTATLNFKYYFDYDDGTFPAAGSTSPLAFPSGTYVAGSADDIVFTKAGDNRLEVSIDGVARNMAVMIWAESSYVRPVTLQGLMTFFTKLDLRP